MLWTLKGNVSRSDSRAPVCKTEVKAEHAETAAEARTDTNQI